MGFRVIRWQAEVIRKSFGASSRGPKTAWWEVMTRFLRFKLTKSSHSSPNDRFAIALHSPDGVIETGLPVCPPEKRAPKLCLQRLAAHFLQSGLISNYRENRAFSANFGSITADFLCPVRLCGGESGIRILTPTATKELNRARSAIFGIVSA
jgi:hypothetical protein